MTLPAAETDRLRALLEQITPGPWEVSLADVISITQTNGLWKGLPIVDLVCSEEDADVGLRRIDAEFIAAARNALPALLEERDALRAELAGVAGEHETALNRLHAAEATVAQQAREQVETIEELRHDSRQNGDPINLTPYIWGTMKYMLTEEERLAFGVRTDLAMSLNVVRALDGFKSRADIVDGLLRAERDAKYQLELRLAAAEATVARLDAEKAALAKELGLLNRANKRAVECVERELGHDWFTAHAQFVDDITLNLAIDLSATLRAWQSETERAEAAESRLRAREAEQAQLRKALEAADEFTYPEISRGPAWANWVVMRELVESALALPAGPPA